MNTLSFKLALNSAEFSRGLKSAALSLGGLLGVALGVKRGFDGISEALSLGGRLNSLSATTGESIANLRALEVGLIGLIGTAESAPRMLVRFQDALAKGMQGGEAQEAWHQLGLDVQKLAQLPAPQAIIETMKALKGLDKVSAAGLATKLFGGRQALTLLQGARKIESFTEDIARGAKQGDFWQKNARSFEDITDSLAIAKEEVQLIFAGLAAGIAPTLQKAVDLVKQVDWAKLGEGIGDFVRTTLGIITDGGLVDLLANTITTAFEMVVAVSPGIFAKLGTVLFKVFAAPLEYLQAGIEWTLQRLMMVAKPIQALMNKLGLDADGLKDFKAQSFAEILAERQSEGVRFNLGSGEFGLGDMDAAATDALASGRAKMAGLWTAFLDRLKERAPEMAAPVKALETGGGRRVDFQGAERGGARTDATSLEKLGFVFNGVGRGFDIQRSMLNALTEANAQRQILIEQGAAEGFDGGFEHG